MQNYRLLDSAYAGEYRLDKYALSGHVFKEYPDVSSGTMFHLTLQSDINPKAFDNYVFSLIMYWRHEEILDSLQLTEEKIAQYEKSIIQAAPLFSKELDQFGYIHLFAIKLPDNKAKLVLACESLDLSQIVTP